jgi:hypothetical protein
MSQCWKTGLVRTFRKADSQGTSTVVRRHDLKSQSGSLFAKPIFSVPAGFLFRLVGKTLSL